MLGARTRKTRNVGETHNAASVCFNLALRLGAGASHALLSVYRRHFSDSNKPRLVFSASRLSHRLPRPPASNLDRERSFHAEWHLGLLLVSVALLVTLSLIASLLYGLVEQAVQFTQTLPGLVRTVAGDAAEAPHSSSATYLSLSACNRTW